MRLATKDTVASFMDHIPETRDMGDKQFLASYISHNCPIVCVSCCKSIPQQDLELWLENNDIDEVLRAKRHLAKEYPFHYGVRDYKVLERKLAKQKENREVLGYA